MSLISHDKINKVLYLDENPSTNDEAQKYRLDHKTSENVLIYTFKQTQGRGQIGKSWFCGNDNNIACSIILNFVNLKAPQSNYLNIWFALVIRSFIASLIPEEKVKIKWPNDIYVENNKIAGLLVQSSILSKYLNHAVLGVGININQEQFPDNLPNPCSIKHYSKKNIDLHGTVLSLSTHINNSFKDLCPHNFSAMDLEYQNLLYLRDEEHEFKNLKTNESFIGKIKRTDEQGALIIEHNGEESTFKFREISY